VMSPRDTGCFDEPPKDARIPAHKPGRQGCLSPATTRADNILSVCSPEETSDDGRPETLDRASLDGPITSGVAVVSFGRQRWALADGDSISIGRQSSSDVRVGANEPGPEDLGISRRAATLSHAQGRIWVRNDSTTQPVYVRPLAGAGYVLEHRGDMISVTEPHLEVVLEGQVMTYRIFVEPSAVAPSDSPEEPATVSPETQGTLPLRSRERRLLAALCEPLLTASGREARPASYREIGARLGLSDHTVRNQLDALREQLFRRGIPGMIGPEAKDNLARYAVRSGSITPRDMEVLERERGEGEIGAD